MACEFYVLAPRKLGDKVAMTEHLRGMVLYPTAAAAELALAGLRVTHTEIAKGYQVVPMVAQTQEEAARHEHC